MDQVGSIHPEEFNIGSLGCGQGRTIGSRRQVHRQVQTDREGVVRETHGSEDRTTRDRSEAVYAPGKEGAIHRRRTAGVESGSSMGDGMAAPECHCVPCTICGGSGSIVFDFRGKAIQQRQDDLDQVEVCDDCGGTGIAEECGACLDAWAQDEEARR